jgi:hypothetical protein
MELPSNGYSQMELKEKKKSTKKPKASPLRLSILTICQKAYGRVMILWQLQP